ncbi:septum formation initiator family protein [Streptomyces sp. VNUA116]|nr:septum formation initiator family protein [Streptomyces sp. VNUA116]WKU44442.1 septum formation initiator family protein [Streptomyces sp. VNUA116]
MTPAARRGTRLGRLVGPVGAKRTPFVLLVVVLLGSGLISLLLLNSALNQGSFELSRLQRKTTELTDEQQALQQEVDQLAAPDALERRARELGMVPGGNPAFLSPDGTVRGQPSPAGDGTVAYRAPAPAGPGPRPALMPAPRPLPVPRPAAPVPPAAGAPAPVPPPAPAPALVPAPTAVPTTPTSGR